jgi:CRISPR-associated protein Cas2
MLFRNEARQNGIMVSPFSLYSESRSGHNGDNVVVGGGDNVVGLASDKRTAARWRRMPERALYLAAYDVSDPKRLRKALDVMKRYATGGQKSVFECFLTEAEKERLLGEITEILNPLEDRFFLTPIDPRVAVRTLGIGIPPCDPPFYYAG